MPHVMALRNGTFLVLGRTGTLWEESGFKAWVYNADGSLKEEKKLDAPKDHPWSDITHLDRYVLNPTAVELPDGRIAITFSIFYGGNATGVAWLGLYGADLQPLGSTQPVAGLTLKFPYLEDDYAADDIVSLGDGSLAVAYRRYDGQAFLRILSKDGVLSNSVSLGPTLGVDPSDVSNPGSVIDLTALPNGKAVVMVRADATKIQGYLLDPSGSAGPVLSDPFSIPVVANSSLKSLEVTTLKGGGFVVTWTEMGKSDETGSEPDVTVKFQVYDADGKTVTGALEFYATAQEAGTVGTPDILALPDGGYALAAQVVPNTSINNSEVRLAIFNAEGERVSDKLLVSKPAAEGVFSLKGLSLLADGRIAAHLSSGIQIVDPRSEAISLKGTAGNDHYIGTAFNDTFDGGAGADILNGGDGIDFVSFASAAAGVAADLSGGTAGDAAGDSYRGIEGLIGSSFNDIFTGNGSAILKGRGGDDTYSVRMGDTVEETAQGGRDTVIASGSYTLRADAEVELVKLAGLSRKVSASLTGSDTANTLTGHSGNNRLTGQGGDDKLYGGQGNDTLYGGTGKDAFVFNTTPNRKTNLDRIADFNVKDDSISLDNAVFTALGKKGSEAKPALLSTKAFWKGVAAHDSSDRIIYDKKTGALYYDKDGTGAAAPVKIATLSKNMPVTHKDFFVI